MPKHYVIFDEIIQGVVSARTNDELKDKIIILLDGVREPIKDIKLPNDIDDLNEHKFEVFYDCEDEEFSIQRVNIF